MRSRREFLQDAANARRCDVRRLPRGRRRRAIAARRCARETCSGPDQRPPHQDGRRARPLRRAESHRVADAAGEPGNAARWTDRPFQTGLAHMDAQGIDIAVLSINPNWYGLDRDLVSSGRRRSKRGTGRILRQRTADRFAAFASVALQFPDLAAEQPRPRRRRRWGYAGRRSAAA